MPRNILISLCIVALILAGARGDDTRPPDAKVKFDASYTVECHDVTPRPTNDQEALGNTRTYEATFRFSVFVISGEPANVKDVVFEIQDKANRLRFTRFEGNKLIPAANGPIAIKKTRSSNESDSKQGSVDGRIMGVLGTPNGVVAGSVGAESKTAQTKSKEKRETETFVREAPKDASFISGTIMREHGVRFTLRPTPQDTLEGMKEFTVRFQAPAGWHGDWVSVRCRANGPPGEDGPAFGLWTLAIGMYLRGEGSAQLRCRTTGR